MLHTRTKHIDVKHHFLRDHMEKKKIKIDYIPTEDQLADIFTKPLELENFSKIRRTLSACNICDAN